MQQWSVHALYLSAQNEQSDQELITWATSQAHRQKSDRNLKLTQSE